MICDDRPARRITKRMARMSNERNGETTNVGLLSGFNHVATLTNDTDRLHKFYVEIFGATIDRDDTSDPDMRLSTIKIGPTTEFNVFEITNNNQADLQTPSFGRGRLDHVGLQAASIESFEIARNRLMAAGAADHFVTDFGPWLSVFFRDPDGMECEILVANPDATSRSFNPPGTPATRYTG